MPVAGRPMVEWSLAALRAAPSVATIVVAVPPRRCRSSLHPWGEGATPPVWEGVLTVDGGAERAESVANAFALVETDLVAIHDAARPLLTPELLEGVVATLEGDPAAAGAIAAGPVTDTIKRAAPRIPGDSGCQVPPERPECVAETLDRGSLWAAQTPQVFRADALRAALSPARLHLGPDSEHGRNLARGGGATDEAMLVEAAGGRVLIHPAPPENPKVTTPLDLRLAELLLRERAPG